MAVNGNPMSTPPLRINFPWVFNKKISQDSGREYYACQIDFDKTNAIHMNFLKDFVAAVNQVLAQQWPDEATRPRIPIVGHERSVVRDGDTACKSDGTPLAEKYPELAGHYLINCTCYNSTIVVVDKTMQDIIDPGEIYSGAICKANIQPYARTRANNPGISVQLNGLQKWEDGDRIGGAPLAASDMFSAGNAPANPFNSQQGNAPANPFNSQQGNAPVDPFNQQGNAPANPFNTQQGNAPVDPFNQQGNAPANPFNDTGDDVPF